MKNRLFYVLLLLLVTSCQQQTKTEPAVNIDSLVNAKVEAKKAEIEEKARLDAEAKVRQEQERKEQEAKAQLESVRPSGNSLREREMRFYYDQGYDFGSHHTFSKMDDDWMHKAFLYVTSQHDMSHAGNKILERSFMAGVAQGRAELRDLQN